MFVRLLYQCQLFMNEILLCVCFCHKTQQCIDLVYGQQSGNKTSVYMCARIIYMYLISLSFHASSKDWWFLTTAQMIAQKHFSKICVPKCSKSHIV
jgi:hypothetical protein